MPEDGELQVTEGTVQNVKIQLPREAFRAVFVEAVSEGPGDGDSPGPQVVTATGSGFFYRVDGNDFLVSARHIFSNRSRQTNEYLSSPAVEPSYVRVRFRDLPPEGGYTSEVPVKIGYVQFRLLDDEGNPNWLEHSTYGRLLDVAALRVAIPDGILALPWEPEDGSNPDLGFAKYWVAQDVSVVGYPYGLMGGFDLPLWVRGTIASEPEIPFTIDDQDLPMFLVDARTREGQSGSPTLLVRPPYTPVPRPDGSFAYSAMPMSKLIGDYTGRLKHDSDLGFVWRIEAVENICRSGVTASLSSS